MRRKRLRIISLFLSMMIMLSTAIPIGSVFAADYDVKYHSDDWFGYKYSKEEITSWIKDAVKYPKTSDEAIQALTGEIRPGDIISFQLEVEMPSTDHEEIMQFMKDFQLNMTLPYGVNAMIEVYASDAPLLTDEQYAQKLEMFNRHIDVLEEKLNNNEALSNTDTDLVLNRNKYLDIYLKQLETAKTKWGFAGSSYGSASLWQGKFEDNPNINLEENTTYESYREKILNNSNIPPSMTNEEYEQAAAEFENQYPEIKQMYLTEFETLKTEYEQGSISEEEWKPILTKIESIHDGTFYETVMQYLKDCRDGYVIEQAELAQRALLIAFSGGIDYYNAWLSQYTYSFSDSIVQQNKPVTYLFDIHIAATDGLSVGNYASVPALHWKYEENCPTQRWISEGYFKGHWEKYYTCNARSSSLMNFGNIYFPNQFVYVSEEKTEEAILNDKRSAAFAFLGDEEYKNNKTLESYAPYFYDSTLKSLQKFTVDFRDENGNLIKSETQNTADAYYNIYPEQIYDFNLIGPEFIKGVIDNKHTTVTFRYEHKDTELAVRYQDSFGNKLAPVQTISGKTLDEYRTTPLEIYGYKPIELPANASGILHEDSEDVEYIYALKDSSVTVNYLDDEGNPIAESETINGKVFDHYETSAKEINGYRLTGTPVNAVGELTEEPITVTYFYTKKDAAVTINYLDESGNVLADSELLAGKYFTPYSTEPKKIYGYELTAIPGNASGTMQEDNTVINYIYRLKPSSVTVTHTDESGNMLSEEEIINGKVFDKYNTASKDFYGYILLHSPKNASGELSETETTVSYIYRKIFDKLPDEPYRAETGDPLSDMELPFGWKFADPDKIFDSAGTHTIDVIVPADETHPEIRGTVTVEVTEKPVTEPPTVTEPDDQPSDPIENTPEEDLPNKPSEPIDKVPSQTDKEEDHSAQEILTINPDTGYDEILLPILLPTVSAGSVLTILLCRILKRKSPKL